MDSFLVRPRRKKFRVGFVEARMEMVTCFGCSFLPIMHVRDLPEFALLLAMNNSEWPR